MTYPQPAARLFRVWPAYSAWGRRNPPETVTIVTEAGRRPGSAPEQGPGEEAAVDHELRPGAEAAGVRRQPHDQLGHLLGRADAAHREQALEHRAHVEAPEIVGAEHGSVDG